MSQGDIVTHRPVLIAVRDLLRPRLSRLFAAVSLGVLSLISALALAGTAAWLITRASQMPPVLDLSVAAVAVRAFAISRAVLNYCGRLATHDAALRAAGSARSQIYRRLAIGPAAAAVRFHSGELMARVGADVDELADVLARAVVPIVVAAVLGCAATAAVAVISVPAGIVLALCLLIAGYAAPRLAGRAAAAEETVAQQHYSERDVAAMIALEHAPELRVAGMLSTVIAESQRHQRAWAAAIDAATKTAAIAEAIPTAAVGVSVLGAVVAGIGISNAVAPTTLAVLMLLPLSAFEATTPLPAAAIQLTRSRIAAARLLDLAGSDQSGTPRSGARTPVNGATASLSAHVLTGHTRGSGSVRVTLDIRPGERWAVTGTSGSGKTTLLMTLAGLIPALDGEVALDGIELSAFDEAELRSAVGFFAEDAHIFATTVRDNLLVARGDCADEDLVAALKRVGLGDWLVNLTDGLSTVLAGGAQALSAGQRRRVLLARAVIAPARVILLDEPTEHLDAVDSDVVLRDLLDPASQLMAAGKTVVVATHNLPPDIGCRQLNLDSLRV
ncbi:thiol reductant ABC exporter subunit CydC [Mycobacterium sp. 1245111.1]|uniref:thiol reductant ABC exporter subunit CydC n=1 Tax=Mycobacterium sp. 1245111.1 TaxID=1834073 RepID=UPI0008000D9B|nr:thiol reductant ABC exporter subunit CydC [Mycobacterium sp. 1245111.1]OBK36788.1 thiol reductant ABC exporter subunit CydC [Mycobacterium sp. 1245111.1]